MKGINTLIINEMQMRDIVRAFLLANLKTEAFDIVSVTHDQNNQFVIQMQGRESVDSGIARQS